MTDQPTTDDGRRRIDGTVYVETDQARELVQALTEIAEAIVEQSTMIEQAAADIVKAIGEASS